MIALISGITGQDGALLAKTLLDKDYRVYGTYRRLSTPNFWRLQHLKILDKVRLIPADLLDDSSIIEAVKTAQPDEVYNLGANSVSADTLIPLFESFAGIRIKTIEELFSILERKHKPQTVYSNGVATEVINLVENTQLRTLSSWAGMGTWLRVRQVSRHKYKGKLIRLRQKWGEVKTTPNHSIYNSLGAIVSPTTNPELLPVRKLNFTQDSYIDYMDIKPDGVFLHDDKYSWLQTQPNTKVQKHLTGDALCAFLTFAGAFIAEGCTSHNKTNGSYVSIISSSNVYWLKGLQQTLDKFSINMPSHITTNNKKGYNTMYHLRVNSKIFFGILRKYLGHKSGEKKMPDKIFSLPKKLRDTLLKTMYEGDGSVTAHKRFTNRRYGTVSPVLAAQVCLLNLLDGIDYTIHIEDNPDHQTAYHIRECHSYQIHQLKKDYAEVDYDGYVYDISVEETNNFVSAIGNVVLHNSFVGASFEQPMLSGQITGLGAMRVLEALRQTYPRIRYYQASTSELYGTNGKNGTMQNEDTPFMPSSPYATAKLFAYWATRNYRESYDMFAVNGILFNHEGSLRGLEFVTRKVTNAVARIKLGLQGALELGNLDAKRDWGWAVEYVESMWLMMQQHQPGDYVIATGETHSVQELVELAFKHVDLDWREYVRIDKGLLRPVDVKCLCGDASKAERVLGWKAKVKFHELVSMMVNADMERWERWQKGEHFPWDAPNYTDDANIISGMRNRGG